MRTSLIVEKQTGIWKPVVNAADFIAWTTVFWTHVLKPVSAVVLKPKKAKKRVFSVQKSV